MRTPSTPADNLTQASSMKPRKRPASHPERELMRRIARFIVDRALDQQSLLVALVLVSKQFPGVQLDDAIYGYVFRSLPAPTRGMLQ